MVYKNLSILLGITLFLTLFTLFHVVTFDKSSITKAQLSTIKLTRFADLSLGVFWYEPRLRGDEFLEYSPYPELPPIDTLGFIYQNKKGFR
jgi:hypothetical protein